MTHWCFISPALYPANSNNSNPDWAKTLESKIGNSHRILTHSGDLWRKAIVIVGKYHITFSDKSFLCANVVIFFYFLSLIRVEWWALEICGKFPPQYGDYCGNRDWICTSNGDGSVVLRFVLCSNWYFFSYYFNLLSFVCRVVVQ